MSWDEIENLRRQQSARLSSGEPENPATAARITALLEQLAAEHDLDAAAQLTLEEIATLLADCRITRCEAFALAMDGLAAAVKRVVGDADNKKALALAWGYLVSPEEQNFFVDPLTLRAVHQQLVYRRSHRFADLLQARSSYEATHNATPADERTSDDPRRQVSAWSAAHSE